MRCSPCRWSCLPGSPPGRIAGSGYGNPWFDALVKPEAMPPGWVFGVAWTILYILLGLVLALLLHAPAGRERTRALALFALQLAAQLRLVDDLLRAP